MLASELTHLSGLISEAGLEEIMTPPPPCVTPFPPLRTEFGLDTLGSGSDTIRAIRELSYKGGNTRTGAALHHVSDRVFLPRLTRPGVPKVFPINLPCLQM